jgi:hypothetical protein
MGACAESCETVYDTVGLQTHSIAEFNVRANDGVGADVTIVTYSRAGANHRSGVNACRVRGGRHGSGQPKNRRSG